VCKHPEILCLLKEVDASSEGGTREDSEEEDVFIPKEKQPTRVRGSHVKSSSKGSSHSSADSLFEEEGEDVERDKAKRSRHLEATPTPEGTERGKPFGHTPKSRPRGALLSDLTSSEGDGEHLDASFSSTSGKSGIRKVRYHLAKVGEAKQKLLGKLEESGEADCNRHGGGGVAEARTDGPEEEDETTQQAGCKY
jgi:hypothetical protein